MISEILKIFDYTMTFSEDMSKDGSVCTEESPLNPITLYGKTKVAAENEWLASLPGQPASETRPSGTTMTLLPTQGRVRGLFCPIQQQQVL